MLQKNYKKAKCTNFDKECGLWKKFSQSYPQEKSVENRMKYSYAQSYPHYPQFKNVNNLIYIKLF